MVCFVFRAVCEPHQTVYGRSHRRGSALHPALSVISQELAAPRAERQRDLSWAFFCVLIMCLCFQSLGIHHLMENLAGF